MLRTYRMAIAVPVMWTFNCPKIQALQAQVPVITSPRTLTWNLKESPLSRVLLDWGATFGVRYQFGGANRLEET